MRILDVDDLKARPISKFGSEAFWITRLAAGQNRVALAQLEAGGSIGRHPAASQQLLMVIHGSVTVSGADKRQATLGPGQGAVWEPGEEHDARTGQGVLAVIIEGSVEL
jgi:quercetin dioxygenase-like cupin family protein